MKANDESLQERIRDFWEKRGVAPAHTDARLTMMAEHVRYPAYVHRQEMRYLDGWLEKLDRPRILDVGCGNGRLAFTLAHRASEIVALDGSSSLIALAKERAERENVRNVTFGVHDAAKPYGEGGFDLVIASGLFNYLSDDDVRNAAAWMRDALVPGGLFYVRNHVANWRRFERREPNPGIYRTGEEYVKLVADAGFEILDERYLFAPLCPPNLAYYHVIPKALRDRQPFSLVLDAWFELEAMTSEARLKYLADVYPYVLRAIRKPTSFRVIMARRK